MKLFKIAYILILLIIYNISFSKDAKIFVENKILEDKIVTRKLFGSFIEFLRHYVNGSRGLWAQELDDRSFDLPDTDLWIKSERWKRWGDTSNSNNVWALSRDRYNKNGEYSQKLQAYGNNEVGIYQYVYLNDSVSHTFYIYHKGDDGLKFYISLRDTLNNLKFIDSVITQSNDWQKSYIKIPSVRNLNYAKIIISINQAGSVLLDEASLMPDNNVHGIRKEVFDLYYSWKPGILRYPGGCYADLMQNKLEHCIGDIDNRKSSNVTWDRTIQRMDFGLHEFIWFCDTIGMEPHITLNLENSTPEEAANYVEYCNGDTTTKFGKLRANNGHPKPFNVKYFEIGNEQWDYDNLYSLIYLKFFNSIKAVDSGVKVIIDGNHWLGYNNFKALFKNVNDKCDIYGYHPAINILANQHPKDSVLINVACQGNLYEEVFFKNINNWIKNYGLGSNLKQGLTEWWTNYGTMKDWILDSNLRNSSLESGMANASMLISMIKYSHTIELAERTYGLGLIRCEINPISKGRIFFGTPAYHVLRMLSNHFGENVLKSEIISEKYYLEELNGFWTLNNNNYLDGVVTSSEDSIFIVLMNRYPHDNIDLEIVYNGRKIRSLSKVYYLWSGNTLDANTYLNPLLLSPKEYEILIDGKLTLLPHSFYIIAVSRDKLNFVDDLSKSDIEIFPNPFDEEFYILNLKSKNFRVELIDLIGNVVYKKEFINEENVKITTGQLSSGIYILILQYDGKILTKKLVKR